MKILLTLDIGTSGLRGVLYSLEGKVLHETSHPYKPTFHQDGKVRQKAKDWENSITAVLSSCGTIIAQEKYTLLGISVTSQRASVLPVDGDGVVLHDAFMWQDKTTHKQCEYILEHISLEEAYMITGLRVDPYFSAPKILWFKDNEPEMYAKTKKFLGVQDYVLFLLTGKYISDYSQGCRTLLMDIEKLKWSEAMLSATGIDIALLPELLPPGSVAGTLLKTIAEKTSMPFDVPVIVAGGDQQVAALGMGVFTLGKVEANTGTGSFMISPTSKPLFHPEQKILCSCSAIPGQWVVEAGVLTTGILYNWFVDEFSVEGDQKYAYIDSLVEKSPPGANGIIALPHFKGSAAPFWNYRAKGIFFNLTLANSKGDVARALLESIVLEMGSNLTLIQELISHEIEEVIVAGGMTKFKEYNQIQADVFALPLRIPATREASSQGALISGLVTLGQYTSYEEAFSAITKDHGEVIEPQKHISELYQHTSAIRTALYEAMESRGMYSLAESYTTYLGEQ